MDYVVHKLICYNLGSEINQQSNQVIIKMHNICTNYDSSKLVQGLLGRLRYLCTAIPQEL